MVMRETLQWMLFVLRRAGECGRCHRSKGKHRCKKKVDANLDKVGFKQLHIEIKENDNQ